MDTKIHYKNKKNRIVKISILILFPLGLLFTFLIYKSKELVFAQQFLSDGEVKGIFFLPDQEKESISYGPKLIYVIKEGVTYPILTTLTDVNEILREYGIEIEQKDVISLNTQYIVDGSIISIVRTDNIFVEKYYDIPYEEEIRKSDKYMEGERNILQKGEDGVRKRTYLNTYEDGLLVKSVLVEEVIQKEPVKQIVEIGTIAYLLKDIEQRGYDCPYWYSVVDAGAYTEEEKRWLKYVMYCESGCNAESRKSNYVGLFQWSPYWWSKQFKENIFDGKAQIKNTLAKYRAGESTRANQWPNCHSKYRQVYPL